MTNTTFPQSPVFKLDLTACSKKVFSLVQNQTGAILLDSGKSEHENSRFDIILSQPSHLVIHQNGETEVSRIIDGTKTAIEQSDSDPFALAEQIWQRTQPDNYQTLLTSEYNFLPFLGGIAGWLSYDLGRSIEKLPSQAINELTCPDMYLAIYDWALIYDSHHHTWYGIDFNPALGRISQLLTKLDAQEQSHNQHFELTSDWQANMSEADYHAKFGQVKAYLVEGDCYQINLAQRFSASYQGDEWHAYSKLTEQNKAPFSAFIRTENNAILSISPERFLELNGGRIETKPIKGTLPRGKNKTQDEALKQQLQSADKDRAENLMIVDLLRNDISRSAKPGTVKVPKLFEIESFPAVHHLVSTIEGELASDKSPFDLLKGAFPGGSITGAPKIRAMEIIEELEPHRRHVYCGAIGYIDWRGKMDTNIAIRTLVTEQNKIYCWAGGGLVYDSKAESEYQETFDKVAKILPCLSDS
ncbi:aminodeoxychorismate synthase component I [Catenovulum sp. SM1970]|uniref:aminodeoxychorismate synthase component I n=1 Tax=Marinifaba aquimaris TaxID=2741323 RepID=UPI001571F775|nr:aminodeoxychorismate synthase component I [Marinifaba aquimaris]NTS77632.1 aminodeoxychorismate synthase component I [Marinifaba aquimaris]